MTALIGEQSPVVTVPNLTNPQAIEGFLLAPDPGSVIPFPETASGPDFEDSEHLPPIVAIGGLFAIKRFYPLYGKLLGRDADSPLPGRARFITPLNHGVGPIEDMRKDVNERFERLADILGEKIYGVGHSLGGLLLTWAVLDNPDIFAGATCVAGAQEGIKKHTLATTGLCLLAGNPAEAKLLDHDSGFMQEHLAQVKEAWPSDVPMDLVATSLDPVVVPPQGFGLAPRSQEPSKRLVVSSWHAVAPITKRIMGNMPADVKPLFSPTVVEHVNIVRSRVVLDHIDERRRASIQSYRPIEQPTAVAN